MWHHRVIHFPIALLLVGFAMEVVSLFVPEKSWRFASLGLLFLGGLGAVASVASGLWIESEHNDPLLETHRLLGIFCMTSALASAGTHFLSSKIKWMKYLRTLFYAIAAMLVLVTGHYGGTMSHGQSDDTSSTNMDHPSGVIRIRPPTLPPPSNRNKPLKKSRGTKSF